jgi:hypothetical protein
VLISKQPEANSPGFMQDSKGGARKTIERVRMSNSLWLILIALGIAGHGIGHLIFLVPTLSLTEWALTGGSWLLSGHVPDVAVKIVGGAPWLAALVGFVAACVGLWGGQEWWRSAAVVSPAVSLLGLAFFSQASQPFLSADAMDVIILVALLLASWPSAQLVGS